MPVILRIERAEPPGRTPLLEAAAAAALAVCLDERAEPGGEWHEPMHAWVDGRIRKVARRARGAHWQAVQELPGITVEVDGAEARALVPGRVAETPKEVARLQISGSELPPDEPGPVPGRRAAAAAQPARADDRRQGRRAGRARHDDPGLAAGRHRARLLGGAWLPLCGQNSERSAWKELRPGMTPAGPGGRDA